MVNKNEKEQDDQFPGYPHYSPKEDIMNAKDIERVDTDVENISRSNKLSSSALPDQSVKLPKAEDADQVLGDVDDDIEIVPGTEADVTKEDLVLLGEKDADFGRRTELSEEGVEEEDLDVPGSEDDDANEEIGEEDEENNYYSLGGDAHEE